MWQNIIGHFRFRSLVNREVADHLHEYGWRIEYTKYRRIVFVKKDRLILRFTFNEEGPSLVTCELWLTKDENLSEPELEGVSIPDCEWYGPFQFDALHGFLKGIYPPPKEYRVAESWRDVKRIVREIREVICRYIAEISGLKGERSKELAQYQRRQTIDYNAAMKLDSIGLSFFRELG
ncbi:MAG: hypothetical protein IT168_30640 [Bryobacterales bacterium]|nr:hypothetical protein [Bryobacterales bacterium]